MQRSHAARYITVVAGEAVVTGVIVAVAVTSVVLDQIAQKTVSVVGVLGTAVVPFPTRTSC